MNIQSAPGGLSGFTSLDQLSAPPPPEFEIPSAEQPFVHGVLDSAIGKIPRINAYMRPKDWLGALKVRCGFGRNDYKVEPGIYALNNPSADSEVLVSANYKLSFDTLRRALNGRDLWILVLDTAGVNVWCAAGKHTMGTDNLIRAIKKSGLAKLVNHRRVIVPQLAGPGISGYKVKKGSGFEVLWGPILAGDIPAYLENGRKATPEMRVRDFPLAERAVLVPNEVKAMIQHGLKCLPLFQILGVLTTPGPWQDGLVRGTLGLLWALGGGLVGGALGPLLLPWLPGRAFALKAVWPALLYGILILAMHGFSDPCGWGLLFLSGAYGSFMLMNFTGSSTYTSLSGVKREMRLAVPLQAGFTGLGLIFWLLGG